MGWRCWLESLCLPTRRVFSVTFFFFSGPGLISFALPTAKMHRRIVAGSRVVDKQRWPHAERLERKREREARNKPEVTEISSVRLSLFISAYKYILTNGLLRVMMRLPFEDGRYAWLRLALLRSSFITKPVVLALVPKWWEEARTVSPRRNEVERPLELEESQRLGRFRIGPRFSYFRTLSTARSLDQTPLYWEAPSSSIRLWQNGVTLSNLSIGNLIGNWQRNLCCCCLASLVPVLV